MIIAKWSLESQIPIPTTGSPDKQATWERTLIDREITNLFHFNHSHYHQVRLRVITAEHASNWLYVLFISSCGLRLGDKTTRVVLGLCLGVHICEKHLCPCSEQVQNGFHGLSWKLLAWDISLADTLAATHLLLTSLSRSWLLLKQELPENQPNMQTCQPIISSYHWPLRPLAPSVTMLSEISKSWVIVFSLSPETQEGEAFYSHIFPWLYSSLTQLHFKEPFLPLTRTQTRDETVFFYRWTLFCFKPLGN